jgi:dihydrofolate reductase
VSHPEIILIAARARNGVIGNEGRLPWHLPADLRHFKQLTLGAPMIMGRKTFESLPGRLPDRRHIVLTRQAGWQEDGAETAHSIEAALRLANAPRVSVIGGAEIYALLMPFADRIELTEVHGDFAGDAAFPEIEAKLWHERARIRNGAEEHRPAYDFVTLQRQATDRIG